MTPADAVAELRRALEAERAALAAVRARVADAVDRANEARAELQRERDRTRGLFHALRDAEAEAHRLRALLPAESAAAPPPPPPRRTG
jgi:vacuolar-type H+-ATPase subunit I/STV1